jgi:RHS repeat-associated protein
MTHPTHPARALKRRAIAATMAALQVLPVALLSDLAQAQQTVPTEYGYDAQGNLKLVKDPNGQSTTFEIDGLNRTTRQTLPKPRADRPEPIIFYSYDGLDRLTQVKDARSNGTSYSYYGLNDRFQYSPDTGIAYTYANELGTPYYTVNGRGSVRNVNAMDELNRPKRIDYFDEDNSILFGYAKLTYDEYIDNAGENNNYGRGYLTRVVEYTGQNAIISSLSLRYDQFGHVKWRCQFWAGVSAGSATACTDADALKYRWNTQPSAAGNPNAGRLMGLTYPSGRLVDYTYDDSGKVNGIKTTHPDAVTRQAAGTAKAVISSVAYTPLDVAANGHAVISWKFGDGTTAPVQSLNRSYETDGRMNWFTLGQGSTGFGMRYNHELLYDEAGHLKTIKGKKAATGGELNIHYEYDNLSRLTKATLPSGAIYSYDYDANGNRTLKTSGSVTTAYTYLSSNNKLKTVQEGGAASQTIATDTTGNIKADPAAVVGAVTYTYEDRTEVPMGRLSKSQGAGAQWSYVHNHFGQRIRKTGAAYTPTGGSPITPAAYIGSADTLFYYDLAGHLIAEHDAATKQVKREYVWLGDMVVSVIAGATPTNAVSSTNAAAIYYVHSDHLNTPRMVTDTSGSRRWSWEITTGEPFGATAVDEAPMGQVAAQQFTLNLRFPGQYMDRETGTFYNYYRTYNPATGRYLQSDPIGLAGGLNTYAYVGGQPTGASDPSGLAAQAVVCFVPGLGWAACALLGTGLILMAPPVQQGLKDLGNKLVQACKPEKPECNATATRNEAMVAAYSWAGISIGGAGSNPIPWGNFNMPAGMSRSGREYGEFMRTYYPKNYGYSTPQGASVVEHPFGHPDMPGPAHHACPHFHAKNASGAEQLFTYKPGG